MMYKYLCISIYWLNLDSFFFFSLYSPILFCEKCAVINNLTDSVHWFIYGGIHCCKSVQVRKKIVFRQTLVVHMLCDKWFHIVQEATRDAREKYNANIYAVVSDNVSSMICMGKWLINGTWLEIAIVATFWQRI